MVTRTGQFMNHFIGHRNSHLITKDRPDGNVVFLFLFFQLLIFKGF